LINHSQLLFVFDYDQFLTT